jgi:hypothetical protein
VAKDDDGERDKPAAKTELVVRPHTQVQLPAAPAGMTNLRARMRAHADRKYYESRTAEVKAHTDMTHALGENLRAQTNLQGAILESEEWNEDIERKRIRTEYAIEDMDLDAALERRRHELEMEARQRELERNPPKPHKPNRDKPQRNDFRTEAENILRHGNAGPHLREAKAAVDALIEERGGEHNLTDDDRAHIEMLYEVARRKDFSKG